MSDAHLTNGAFYAHFTSKDDLVASVIADQMQGWQETLGSAPLGRSTIEEFIRGYLSPRHRDHADTGCPSAALLDEISRCDKATRRVYTKAMQTSSTSSPHTCPLMTHPPHVRRRSASSPP